MLFDGTDIVKAKVIYKDHIVDNEKVRVFVDWGTSTCEDFVIYGSPFQVGGDWFSRGAYPDSPVTFVEERVDSSFPQDGQDEVATAVGPIHYKPGVNL